MPILAGNLKICVSCRIAKPLSEFHSEPRVASGTTAKCRACSREWQEKWRRQNPEKIKVARQKYAAKFPDRVARAAKLSQRLLTLERRERRFAEGKPLLEPRITDDGRLCSRCRHRKDSKEFAGPNEAYCRDCRNAVARAYAKKPHVQEYRRKYMRALLLKKYGMTLADFDQLLAAQNGRCAICPEELKLGTGGCAIDHDHKSNKVRGILCRLCNVGIGHFRENEDLMISAIQYLRQHAMALRNEEAG